MRTNFSSALSPLPPKVFAAPAIPQDVPCYRILKACFLDDRYCFEGDIVSWGEEPNKEMEPLNDLAVEAVNNFFDERDEQGKVASAAKGFKYVPLRRPVEEERAMNSSEKRRVEIIKGDGGVPIMGARSKGKVRKLQGLNTPQTPVHNLMRSANEAKDSGIE